MKKFRRLYPHTIYGQMVMLVSLSMILTLSVISFLLYQFRPVMPPVPPGPWANAQAMETGIQALQAAPLATREAIAKKFPILKLPFLLQFPYLVKKSRLIILPNSSTVFSSPAWI